MDQIVRIRIIVLRVPPGIIFAVQRGRAELLLPSQAKDGSLTFEFEVRVSVRSGAGSPNLLGPYAQGKPDDRFIYLNSGTLAGQRDCLFSRRAKIKTAGINWDLIDDALTHGTAVETQVEGRARDGGPCCATVPLLGGWRVSQASGH